MLFHFYSIVTTPENKTMVESSSNSRLTEQYRAVQEQLAQACAKSGRSIDDVQLLAVSKRHSVQSIEHIYQLGQRAFGENYVQEAVEKSEALSSLDIEWHFIGPIQSNKSRLVAESMHWVHTVDREKIARRLDEQRPSDMGPLNVLIQVNVSQQDSKSGITLSDIPALAQLIDQLPNLELRGLMCIPAPANETDLEQDFMAMQSALNELRSHYPTVDTLSMGMSQDLELAVTCGSSLVRIGTAIFGQRD